MTLTQLVPPYPIFTDRDGSPLDAGYLYFGEPNLNPETNPIQVYYDPGLTQPLGQPIRTANGYVMRNGSPALIYADGQFSVTVRNKKNELVIYSPVGFGITPSVPFAVFENSARDVSALLSGTQFTYSAGIPNTIQVVPGEILRTLAEGFAYEVAASSVTDQHATTAGGVKLYVQPEGIGYNVKAFGATGDGVSDDTAYINTAIRALKPAVLDDPGYGHSLCFPRGQYLITDTINLVDIRGSRIFGEARGEYGVDQGSGFVWAGGNTKPMFALDFFKGATLEELSFRSIDNTTNLATACLEFKKVSVSGSTGPSQFKRLWIEGALYGVMLGDLSYNNLYNVSEVYFEHTRINCRYGVYNAGVPSGGQNVNNVFFCCHFGGDAIERAFWLDGGNIIVDKCTFNGSASSNPTTVLYVTGDVTLGIPTVLRDCYAEQIDRVLGTEYTAAATQWVTSGLIVIEYCWWNVNNPNHAGTNYLVECYKDLEVVIRDCRAPVGDILYSPPANQSFTGFSANAPSSRVLRFEGFNTLGAVITTSRGGYIVSNDRQYRNTIPTGFLFPSAGVLTIGDQVESLPEYGVYVSYGTNGTFDLNTISGGLTGDVVILQGHPTQATFRIPNVKHATGNLFLTGGVDMALNTATKKILLQKSADGTWGEMSRVTV